MHLLYKPQVQEILQEFRLGLGLTLGLWEPQASHSLGKSSVVFRQRSQELVKVVVGGSVGQPWEGVFRPLWS